jgi:hypothetical protein
MRSTVAAAGFRQTEVARLGVFPGRQATMVVRLDRRQRAAGADEGHDQADGQEAPPVPSAVPTGQYIILGSR